MCSIIVVVDHLRCSMTACACGEACASCIIVATRFCGCTCSYVASCTMFVFRVRTGCSTWAVRRHAFCLQDARLYVRNSRLDVAVFREEMVACVSRRRGTFIVVFRSLVCAQ